MKKIILCLCALLVGLSASATTETLIYKYDFSKWSDKSKFFYGNTAFQGSNLGTVDESRFDANYGLLSICGGQMPGQYTNFLTGTSIQDFGGDIGKVLCINGKGSNVNNALAGYAPSNFATIPEIPAGSIGYVNLVFFSNPNNTPKSSAQQARIRVKILFNVHGGGNLSTFNRAYSITAGNTVTAGEITNGTSVSNSEFQTAGEWDPTKWMLYEFDTWCPTGQSSLRFKLELNRDAIAGNTIFIKEVSFYEVTNVTDNLLGQRRKTVDTYQIFPNMKECLIKDKVVLSKGDWCNFFAAGETIPSSLSATVSTPAGSEVESKYFDASTGTFKFYDSSMVGNAYTVNLNWTADGSPKTRTVTVLCRDAADASEEGAQPIEPIFCGDVNTNDFRWTVNQGTFYVQNATSQGTSETTAMVNSSFQVSGNTIKYIGTPTTDTNTYYIYNIVGDKVGEPYAIKFKNGIFTSISEVGEDNAPVEYFNLNGVKVTNPTNGVFIRMQGNKANKVVRY